MNDAKGWDALADIWNRVTDGIRHHDVIDGEVVSVVYHDEVKAID